MSLLQYQSIVDGMLARPLAVVDAGGRAAGVLVFAVFFLFFFDQEWFGSSSGGDKAARKATRKKGEGALASKRPPAVRVVHHLFAYPAECNFDGAKHCLGLAAKLRERCLGQLRQLIIEQKQREKQRQEAQEEEEEEEEGSGESVQPPVVAHRWWVLLDAAKYASTSPLNLGDSTKEDEHRKTGSIEQLPVKPDFVTVSFYKVFGYPTGLGALLVRRDASRRRRER